MYFVDTHVLLWALSEPEKLSIRQREILEDTNNIIYFSSASIWEIAIKVSIGKLKLHITEEELLDSIINELGCKEVFIDSKSTIQASRLPYHHKDPFDRIIMAQCQLNNATLLTNDVMITRYDITIVN